MIKKDISIASWNIRALSKGLIGLRKKIKNFLLNSHPTSKIILLPEHRFSQRECLSLTNSIDIRLGTNLWNEASYCVQTQRHKGGNTILLYSSLSNMVREHGILILGRLQFIVLQVKSNS